MRHLDVLHLLYPFYGARRLRDAIVDDHGLIVNRKLVRRLMILMDIQAIFPDNKGTSKPDKVHRIYPYLLKNLEIYHSNQVWCTDITYLPTAKGFAYLVAIIDWQSRKIPGAPCYLTKFRDSCRLNSFTYAANGRCPERPASVTTTHKSRFVITPSNGWTAIRNAILASLARYRALRLSELPCRLSGTKNHHFAIAPFP